jgi:hypothetical protein
MRQSKQRRLVVQVGLPSALCSLEVPFSTSTAPHRTAPQTTGRDTHLSGLERFLGISSHCLHSWIRPVFCNLITTFSSLEMPRSTENASSHTFPQMAGSRGRGLRGWHLPTFDLLCVWALHRHIYFRLLHAVAETVLIRHWLAPGTVLLLEARNRCW